MKKVGFRRIDDLGRVTIPSEYRARYNLNEHDKVDFIPQKDGVLLKKLFDKCIFCDSEENLTTYHNKTICLNCKKEMI